MEIAAGMVLQEESGRAVEAVHVTGDARVLVLQRSPALRVHNAHTGAFVSSQALPSGTRSAIDANERAREEDCLNRGPSSPGPSDPSAADGNRGSACPKSEDAAHRSEGALATSAPVFRQGSLIPHHGLLL